MYSQGLVKTPNRFQSVFSEIMRPLTRQISNCFFSGFSTLLLMAMLVSVLMPSLAVSAPTVPNLVQVTGHGIPGMYMGTARAADFDGDGKVDIVYGGAFNFMDADVNGSGKIKVYKNISTGPGDIRFELLDEITNTNGKISNNFAEVDIRTGDYDADGDIDFFATFTSDQETVIATNDGTGKFTVTYFPFIGRHIALGNIDNSPDGYLELINSRDSAPLYYSWNGTGWTDKQLSFTNDICFGHMTLGDLNGDGFDDVLIGGNCNGFGTFRYPDGSNVFSQWHKNNAGVIEETAIPLAQFSPQNLTTSGGMDNGSYVIADFDLDGDNDIAFSGSHSGFQIHHYDFVLFFNVSSVGAGRSSIGNGSAFEYWENQAGGAANVETPAISAADINNDGYPDVFFMGHKNIGNHNYVFDSQLYLNDLANPNGETMTRIYADTLPPLGRGNGVFADFDNDGRVDLLYHGAENPFHYNCACSDNNVGPVNVLQDVNLTDADITIKTYIYRNTDAPVDTTKPSTPTGLQATAISESVVNLSWQAASDAESKIARYNIYRDGSKVASVAGTNYQDSSLTGATTYRYRVAAVNGAGLEGDQSTEVAVTTPTDTVAPTIVSASALDATTVQVVFSEALDSISAQNVSNYTISPSTAISAATLSTNSVTLTTANLTANQTYTLTVNGVKDMSKLNTIAANSQVSFQYTVSSGGGGGNSSGSYVWRVLADNEPAYNDRDYYFVNTPGELVGLNYLQTANDDRTNTDTNFLTVSLNEASTIYVAYDERNGSAPGWLNSWTSTNMTLTVQEPGQAITLRVYSKAFAAGSVVLSGNGDTAGSNSMYVVVVNTDASLGGGNGTGTGTGSGSGTGSGTGTGGGTGNGGTDTPATSSGGGSLAILELLMFLGLAGLLRRRSATRGQNFFPRP